MFKYNQRDRSAINSFNKAAKRYQGRLSLAMLITAQGRTAAKKPGFTPRVVDFKPLTLKS